MANIGYQLGDDDSGFDHDKWIPCDGSPELVSGLEDFLRQTANPVAPEVFQRIRDEAHARVALSRLESLRDVEGLGDAKAL